MKLSVMEYRLLPAIQTQVKRHLMPLPVILGFERVGTEGALVTSNIKAVARSGFSNRFPSSPMGFFGNRSERVS
jgi:hypothetical protein